MSETRTEISTLGEFGLIQRINKNTTTVLKDTITGIGDDAAVIDLGDEFGLLTTDMLLEGVHFDLSFFPLKHLGYKSIAVNVSDIAAMNGKPHQATISIALSNRFSVEAVDEFYEGVKAACKDFNLDLVGGDTTSSNKGFFISVGVLGITQAGKSVRRNGAKPGDLICATGDLGAAYLGLQILEREKSVYADVPDLKPDLDQYTHLLGRLLKPEARRDIIQLFETFNVIPSAMMDISDGLSSELFHICEASGCGAIIYEDQIPIHETTKATAAEFAISPTICALNGGEDYELLFTISEKEYAKIENLKDIAIIGEILSKENGIKIETDSGNQYELQAQGWNPLKTN